MNETKESRREARYRLFEVDEQHILQIVRGVHQHDFCCLPWRNLSLPDDVVICAVHYDYARRSFVFKIWHESFDIVPNGGRIMVVSNSGSDLDMETITLDLKKLRALGMVPE